MTYKTYYKLGSLCLVISSFAFAFLIIAPFIEAESEVNKQRNALMNEDLDLEEELRMHRELYMQVSSSGNPVISNNLKDHCKQGIASIDQNLYIEETLTPQQEMELRKKLNQINFMVTENINIPYLSVDVDESM